MIKKRLLEEVNRAIVAQYGEASQTSLHIDLPPSVDMGDYAFGMFPLAKQFRKAPNIIAQEVAAAIVCDGIIASVEVVGPYVNVRLDNSTYFSEVCSIDLQSLPKTGKRIMVEYLSPNTNKPLHLGHMRNGALGMAVSNMLEWNGDTVVKANLINDRGVHICKSMISWMHFSNGATPESSEMKGDHFVGKYYVRFAQAAKEDPLIEKEAQNLLKKWEDGDEDVVELWKIMNEWVYAGFAQTYDTLGLLFDVFIYESETYKLGKDIIDDGLERDIFVKDPSGTIVFELPEKVFGLTKDGSIKRVTVLRNDGTSVYMTQDIGTALKKADEYNLDASVYVVGSEQEHHFKCLFDILQTLGYEWASNCHHLSYGMVELPEGKMKSREGKVVDADDLAREVIELAESEVRAKHGNEISDEEITERASKIGIGAIKFYLAKVNPRQTIRFNPAESISFDGITGPYCQYAYARACGIAKKVPQGWKIDAIDYALLGSNIEERILAQKMMLMKDKIVRGATDYNPSVVAAAIYDLAKAFSQLYNKHYIIDENDVATSKARLALVAAVASSLENSLHLLGVEVLEKM